MKILFLDIDGVINTDRAALAGYRPADSGAISIVDFDPVGVGLLRALCKQFDVKIVLSSSWKYSYHYSEIGAPLGLPIIDQTPNLDEKRGDEIAAWLDKWEKEGNETITHYVIVDDYNDMLTEQQKHLVQTSAFDGITWERFGKICNVLDVNRYDIKGKSVRRTWKHE